MLNRHLRGHRLLQQGYRKLALELTLASLEGGEAAVARKFEDHNLVRQALCGTARAPWLFLKA